MDAITPGGQTPVAPQAPQAPKAEEKQVETPKDSFKQTPVANKDKLTGIWKGANAASKSLFAGFGFGSGAVGGFAIGGAIGTTGNVISSLFQHSLTMAGATGAGLTGGIIGGVIFGLCGMIGGYQFGSLPVKLAHKAVNLIKDQFAGK